MKEMEMNMDRRKFISTVGAGILSAPAIVRANSIMPIRLRHILPFGWKVTGLDRFYDGVSVTAFNAAIGSYRQCASPIICGNTKGAERRAIEAMAAWITACPAGRAYSDAGRI